MRSLVAFDHCRVPLRQFVFVRRQDPVARLHQLALAADPVGAAPPAHAHSLLTRAAWALICLRQVATYHRRFARHVRNTDGVSRWRQFRDAWYCMWRHNQSARHYYWRKLFLLPTREAWLDNFEHRQTNTLLDHLNAGLPVAQITDKLRFHEHCRTHGLPTAPVLVAWAAGGQRLTPEPADPQADVFIKPARDFGSVGTVAIRYDAATHTYELGGQRLTWTELLPAIAAQHASHGPYLLQRRLRNSPAMAVFGQQDVCNVRVITGCTVRGEIELIAAVVRLPSSFTTTGHDRNVLLSTVDIGDGRLSAGMFRNILLPQFERHPDTGHPLAGWTLPRWNDIRALAFRAHATCPWIAFVGWDVIDSDQGVLLLEANANWGGDSAQLPGAPGLGQTRFPAIYLEWLQKREDVRRVQQRSNTAEPA